MFQAPASLHNNPLCQRPFQPPLPSFLSSCLSLAHSQPVRGGHEEGLGSNTWPHTIALHHQHSWSICEWAAEDNRDQRRRANGESDHHDLMGQLGARNEKTPSNPRPNTHTHTHPMSSWTTDATMGIRECGRRGIGVGLQELKESGCVWNFGSCLSPHIPHFSRNNKLCHSRYNGLLLDTLHHKKPQTREKHAVTPWTRVTHSYSCGNIKTYYI